MNQKNLDSVITNEEPKKHLSLPRVILALLLLGGLAYAMFWSWDRWQERQSTVSRKPWFASYVDVTATPSYPFEQLGATSTNTAILSFIVSSPSDACTPSWGGAYTLGQASTDLDLDRRVARLRQLGGSVSVSFGGLLNNELALNCSDPSKLLSAYQSVVDRYDIDTIDLDIEGSGLSNTAAGKRRAKALASLQKKQRAEKKNLAIWLTLPVSPEGLSEEGTNEVAQMLANGVDLAGINVMTMDYSNSLKSNQTMEQASEEALIETHRQLGILYKQVNINLSSATLWSKIGATPMIGQNDTAGEVFTLKDAAEFNKFALSQGVGRMSMWSANRDIECGENYVDVKVVSDSCSGVKQDKLSFSVALSQGFDGVLEQNAALVTTNDAEAGIQKPDDPKTSPYQIWKEAEVYLAGTKVVWHQNVYQAKWWTQGDLPDNPVLQSWQTPWQLIGPVLPGETPMPQLTLPQGTYPTWSGTTEYTAGERVLLDGLAYQAKWWTQGDSPAASAENPDSSPWIPLTQAQISELLKADIASSSGVLEH